MFSTVHSLDWKTRLEKETRLFANIYPQPTRVPKSRRLASVFVIEAIRVAISLVGEFVLKK